MDQDPYTGEIALFAGINPNDNSWLPCDGRNLPVSGNETLYSLIGTTFGGVSGQNFNLPDLRGRVPLGSGKAASGNTYHLGQSGGNTQVSLTLAQLPLHAHPMGGASGGNFMVSSHAGTSPQPTATANTIAAAIDNGGGAEPNNVYNGTTPNIPWNTGSNPVTTSVVGSATPFSIMQTYTVVGYYICIKGNYPSPS